MKRLFFYLLILAGSLVSARPTFAQDDYNIQGVMQFDDLEGGCWHLQDLKGNKFEVVGPEEMMRVLHVDGRHVSLMVHSKVGHSSLCMLGPLLEVTEILDTVAHPRDPVLYIWKVSGKIKKTKSGCYYLQTKKGLRYEIDPNAPAKFRKAGRKFSGFYRIVDSSMSKCNMDGVLVGEASKAQIHNAYPEK